MCVAWFAPRAILRSILDIKVTANMETRCNQSTTGALLICPHYSTLELSGPALSMVTKKLSLSHRPHELTWVDDIASNGRSRFGSLVNARDIRGMIQTLREGSYLWFAPDQDMGQKGSVFAPFFNNPAATVTTPSRLAKITRARVFFVRFKRRFFHYYLELVNFPDGFPFDDEKENAAIINRFIEESILECPSQYLWLHRRFKTQPGRQRYSIYDDS